MQRVVKTYHLSVIRVRGNMYSYIPIGQSRQEYTRDLWVITKTNRQEQHSVTSVRMTDGSMHLNTDNIWKKYQKNWKQYHH